MWMPTLWHSSNHIGYNNRYRYNHQDCNRTPSTPNLPTWRTGNVNFIEILEIGVYSSWDLCETVTITQTNQPLLHHPPWKGGVTGFLIAPIGQCHWEKTPVSTKIKSRQTVWKNFQISSDALNAFGDAPTILKGKTLIQTPASPISTQESVPVDLVKTMDGPRLLMIKRHPPLVTLWY